MSNRVQLHFDPEVEDHQSKTVQAGAFDHTPSAIMERYSETGVIPRFNVRDAIFGDTTHVRELQDAYDLVDSVNDAFDELPARTRARFDQDPIALFEFLKGMKDEHREEAIDLGLIKPNREEARNLRLYGTLEPPKPTPSNSSEEGPEVEG